MSIHLIPPGNWYDSNIYVVTGRSPILVDTGTGIKVDETLDQIGRLLDGEKVDTIVLTHRHFDHVGGAWRIQMEHGAKARMLPEDAVPVREGDADSTLGRQYGGKIMPMEVEDLHEGETLSTGEHELEVIRTPGHTEGSLSLYDREGEAIIAGDTVFVGGVGRWDLPTGDREQLVASLRRLMELGPTDLYPGHGPVAKGNAVEQIVNALRSLGEI